jgi:hypothetical protein
MGVGLFTGLWGEWADFGLSGPFVSEPVAYAETVNFLQAVENTTIARRHS